MDSEDVSTILTNLARPKTSATITIRVIKSFEYRTEKNLVLHDVNLETTTVDQLKSMAREGPLSVRSYMLFLVTLDQNYAVQRYKRLPVGKPIVQ